MHSLSQVSSFCKTHRWSVRNLSEIMPYIWLDLTAGVVLVITGMILFYLRKGTEKAIKMGEHQLDVPRSFGGRYVEAWQIYLSRKRNIKMVIENGRV